VGLDEDVVTDEQLYRIADAAAGDARLAIGILRTAAGRADRENHEHITDDMLLTPPRMRGPKSNSEVSTRSHPTSASSTRLCANTGRLGPARFTSAILRRQMTRGPNGLCERTSRRWHSTTFWKRRERVGTGSIPLLIRQQHRRWSDSSVVSYPQQHSLNPIVRSPVAREPANRCSRGWSSRWPLVAPHRSTSAPCRYIITSRSRISHRSLCS